MEEELPPVAPPTVPDPAPTSGPLPPMPSPRVPTAGIDEARVGPRIPMVLCALLVLVFTALPLWFCVLAWVSLAQAAIGADEASRGAIPPDESLFAACPLAVALVLAASLRNLTEARWLGRAERSAMRLVVALPPAVVVLTVLYVVIVLSGFVRSAR